MNDLRAISKWSVAIVLLIVPWLSSAQTTGTHDTGTVLFDVYDQGILGAGANVNNPGYTVAADPTGPALFEGQFLLAASPSQVSGSPLNPFHEWTMVSPVIPLAPPFPVPYDEFQDGFNTIYDDSLTPNPIDVLITQNSYSSSIGPDNDYIIIEAEITNQSGGDLTGLYAGIFADWDVGGFPWFVNDLADYDAANQLIYVWDDSDHSTFYYGCAFLGTSTVSGYAFDATGTGPLDAEIYTALTTTTAPPGTPEDRRIMIGAGPYDITNGASKTVQYAFLHGDDLSDLQANAAAAHAAVFVAIDPGPDGLPGTHNLSTAYPNPFNPQTNFTLEVAEQQSVRIAVYDALGREVATLFNGTLGAGPAHEFAIDGAGLPSGIYLVRVTGETFSDALEVTLLK